MSVFLLALVGPAVLETILLSLGFVDVVSPPPFVLFLLLLPRPIHFIYIFSFYSTYLANFDIVTIVWDCNF